MMYRYLSKKATPGNLVNDEKARICCILRLSKQRNHLHEFSKTLEILGKSNASAHMSIKKPACQKRNNPRMMLASCKTIWKSNDSAPLATTNWPSAGKSVFNYMNSTKPWKSLEKAIILHICQ